MKILQVSPISRIFAEVRRLPLPAFHRLNTFLQMADEKIIFSMNGVGKVLPQNNRVILKDIYLSFFYGAKIGIIGLNGSGKSTLMKIIAGIEKQYQGEVVWAPGYSVGYLEQEPQMDPNKTVLEVVQEGVQEVMDVLKEYEQVNMKFCEPMSDEQMNALIERQGELTEKIEHLGGWEIDAKLERAMDALQCPPSDALVANLSGGERRRVALCRLLLQQPDVLLLDEPTNHLDLDAIAWLEEFLINFENTVIVVSHDRYFLNKVCTNIADMDYGKIQLYAGNYDFWYESSQLLVRQMKEANKKKEEKIKELQEFISRFSANASKSKQATSRKRALEKIQLDDIRPSSRKYPYIDFRPNREIGNEVLTVDGISKTIDGVKVLDNISFIVGHDDKIAFVGGNELAKTTLFKILAGEMEPDEGSYKWGVTTSQSYFPKDNTAIFDSDELIVDWLTQYSEIKDATYVRGFLGRMLFAGEDGVKKMRVLSGGEKVRVLLSRMMIMGSNVLIFDEPTDHLDMESITALNNGMIKFPGVILFACRDHQVVQTTANRIIEFLPDGSMVDKVSTYDEYLESDVMARKRQVYNTTADEEADD